MDRFRQAVESGDADAVIACLADDIVFESPIVWKPYVGKAQVTVLLRAVMRVFKQFEYKDTLRSASQTALEFKARVGEREIHGIDLGTVDAEGRVTRLTVFVRPFSAAEALAKAMQAELGAPR